MSALPPEPIRRTARLSPSKIVLTGCMFQGSLVAEVSGFTYKCHKEVLNSVTVKGVMSNIQGRQQETASLGTCEEGCMLLWHLETSISFLESL